MRRRGRGEEEEEEEEEKEKDEAKEKEKVVVVHSGLKPPMMKIKSSHNHPNTPNHVPMP